MEAQSATSSVTSKIQIQSAYRDGLCLTGGTPGLKCVCECVFFGFLDSPPNIRHTQWVCCFCRHVVELDEWSLCFSCFQVTSWPAPTCFTVKDAPDFRAAWFDCRTAEISPHVRRPHTHIPPWVFVLVIGSFGFHHSQLVGRHAVQVCTGWQKDKRWRKEHTERKCRKRWMEARREEITCVPLKLSTGHKPPPADEEIPKIRL